MRQHPWRAGNRLLVFLWNALAARLDFISAPSAPGAPRGNADAGGNVFIAAAARARDTIRARL
ncbi:MAG: hypothetical protein HZA89_17320 [Verrucomicrobia bacterium]|nr:hypothetical protein [Verrucomicrobiota bacterium]